METAAPSGRGRDYIGRREREEGISDLIGEEGDADAETACGSGCAGDGARVWRLNNKYYSARVRVQTAAGDSGAAERVQAHVVLLQPHEASTPRARRSRAPGVSRPADSRPRSVCAGRRGAADARRGGPAAARV